MKETKFTITKDHLKLLNRMFVEWMNDEYGAPCIDPKRPYGNSDVESDIVEILGLPTILDRNEEKTFTKETAQIASDIHRETKTALQICLCTQQFKTGVFIKIDQYDDTSWVELDPQIANF